MALVYPFRAFRYNPEIAPFDRVLTQPYDKISPAQQEKYYAADPHNLITVEKGRSFPDDTPQNNVYTRAAAALKNWIAGRAVAQDAQPAFYAYSQEFTIPGTSTRSTRLGFIGAGKARGLCERSSLSPRTYSLRAQGGPPGTASPYAHPHRAIVHAVFGPFPEGGCDSF